MVPEQIKSDLIKAIRSRLYDKHENINLDTKEPRSGFETAGVIALDTIENYFEETDFGTVHRIELDTQSAEEALSEIEAQVEQLQGRLDDMGIDLEVLTDEG